MPDCNFAKGIEEACASECDGCRDWGEPLCSDDGTMVHDSEWECTAQSIRALAATHDPAKCRECRVLAAAVGYEAARSAVQAFDRDDVDALCDLEAKRRIDRMNAAKRRVRTAERALIRAVRGDK